jgi:hypothetical protein
VQSIVLVAAIVTGSTGAFLVSQGSRATVVAATDVLADFRRDAATSPTGVGSTVGIEPTADPVTTATSEATAVPSVSPTSSDAIREPAAQTVTPDPAAPTSPSPSPSHAGDGPTFGMPEEGVYTYATEGWETVSMAGARHDYPSETYAAVRHLGGCGWETDHRFVEEHRERKEYCSDGAALLALGFDSYITFFGQAAESHGRCDPPQLSAHLPADPGQQYTSSCSGDGWTSDAVVTFVGREAVQVGGHSVEALHYTQKTTLQGSNRGESDMDVWYHPETGLPLEVVRRTQSWAQAFGGEVEYNEDVHFALTSLDPQR